jgi:hypothetical protein
MGNEDIDTSALPLSTTYRANMRRSLEFRRHHHKVSQEGSLPHIPIGLHEIPLLEHQHPPLNFARRHHNNLPHHDDPGYAHYKDMQRVAFANAVRELEEELGLRSNVQYLELKNNTLILRHFSQSKLSQQELADLQKATHFDKKELQQWYKGAH